MSISVTIVALTFFQRNNMKFSNPSTSYNYVYNKEHHPDTKEVVRCNNCNKFASWEKICTTKITLPNGIYTYKCYHCNIDFFPNRSRWHQWCLMVSIVDFQSICVGSTPTWRTIWSFINKPELRLITTLLIYLTW